MQAQAEAWRCDRETIGFVPTMGALHEGHLTLARQARAQNTRFVASIFVNPTQFGPHEDLKLYPRPFERDCELLREAGCDALFTPSVEAMYGAGGSLHEPQTSIEVSTLSELWEGAARPGHFRGVATVVAKLLHITHPHQAYFGEKDYQQLKLIQRMVHDLNFDVNIVPVPTVREPDGLALSSRNAYLTPEQRAAAPTLRRALQAGAELAGQGERDSAVLGQAMQRICDAQPLVQVQYIAIVDAETLQPVGALGAGPTRALIAARVGDTRLIDNVAL